jgi:ssDNA-binding Zn-finger/Zn-ribbon topoisomerase 1
MTVERDQLSKAESVTVAHAATIEAAIARAEKASGTTCEACGRRGRLRQTDLGYRYTACDDHVVD